MESPGITIRPLRQLTGSTEFSEVFLEQVRVPRAHVIGTVDQGWEIALTTLAHERGTGFAFKEQVLQKIAVEEWCGSPARAAWAATRGCARRSPAPGSTSRSWGS